MPDNSVGDQLVSDLKDDLTLGPARRAVKKKISDTEDAITGPVKRTVASAKDAASSAYQGAVKWLNSDKGYEVKQKPKKPAAKRTPYKR